MPPQADKKLLRFGCPACGMRLVVDPSLAGTEGPCPSCSAPIVAPPVEAAATLAKKTAAPLTPKPRPMKSVKSDAPSDTMQPVPSVAPTSETKPKPLDRQEGRIRSVSPTTGVSRVHEEKKDLMSFAKILIACIIVGIIVAVVFYVVSNK